MKKEERKILVTFAQANNVSYDYEYYICENELDSKELVNTLLAQVMEECEYTQEEINQVYDNADDDYYQDLDGGEEWFIRIDTAEVYKGGEE